MADILTDTYQRIRLRLKAGAGKLLADAEAAEDALQDAFIKLWGRYPVRNEKEAEALLTRTVRNTSIDQLRKRKTVPLAGDLPEVVAELINDYWNSHYFFVSLKLDFYLIQNAITKA